MITAAVAYGITMGIYLGGVVATIGSDGDGPPMFLAVIPLLWLVQAGVLAFSIVGAVRASQGVWWRYPISIRFVRGARPAA